jgi:hypothetical protein
MILEMAASHAYGLLARLGRHSTIDTAEAVSMELVPVANFITNFVPNSGQKPISMKVRDKVKFAIKFRETAVLGQALLGIKRRHCRSYGRGVECPGKNRCG